MTKIVVTPGFAKALKKLDKQIADRAVRSLEDFEKAPGLNGLNLEPVQGADGQYTMRVNQNFRILLMRPEDADDGETVLEAIAVKKHEDAYRKRKRRSKRRRN